jgi:hypothetical protein
MYILFKIIFTTITTINMKRLNSFRSSLLLFNLLILLSAINYAHDTPVHQYVAKQAYYFLENEKGLIQEFKNRMGLSFNGPGDDNYPWQTGYIGVAAMREDLEDPIWGYGGLFNGWTPTSTHFWDADNGDDVKTPIPLSADAFNAYYKAKIYLFGGHRILYQTKAFDVELNKVILGYLYSYSSVIELYKTGRYFSEGYVDLSGTIHLWQPEERYMNLESARKFAVQILGRVVHLLTDMSVPAHAHNDLHADGDGYEDWMGIHYLEGYNEPPFIDPIYWDAWNAARQGPLIDVYKAVHAYGNRQLRYLFYTVNQIADRFPSDDSNGDDSYSTNYIGDDYSTLNLIQEITHSYNSGSVQPFAVNKYAFRYCIRAVAGLYYWFVMETDMLPNTLILNNFQGGNIKVNNIDFYSGYRIEVNNSSSTTLQAIDQVYDNCYWRFQNWQKIVNGVVVQTFNTRSITITPTANTTYKANFTSENYFNWVVTGPLKGLYRGESRVFNIYPFYGNPPASYFWHTKYRSVYNGQTYWTDGLPDGCSISFISNGTNTATFTNNYFSKYCGSWADSVIRVYGTVVPAGCGCSNQTFFEEITLKDRTRPGSPPPPPPPGGCPYVYTWNGNTWIEENNILPQSQDLTLLGQNVTDYYQLYTKPVEEDGKYYLAISEYEEDKSFFDQLKLLVIDHPEESFITVDDSGTVIQFAKPAFFANAQLDSNDVYKQLLSLDDIKTEVSESDVLSLSFEDVNSITENWLLLIGQVEAVAKEKVSAKMVSKNNNGKESSATFSSFRLRKNPTYQWVLAPTSSSSTLQIDIAWQEDAQVDYTELSNRLELPFILSEAELLSASHSALGDIKNEIMLSDGIVSELNKDEWIELAYSIPPIIQGMQRSFVLVSNGRYEHIIERYKYNVSGKNQLLKNNSGSSKPLEYRLEQNYPNPFNPASTINYSVKENGYVRLKVYDIIGNEVAELVNGNLDAGNYSVEFDAGGLPSGVYIYTIQVNNFFDSKKMILIK